MVLQFHFGAGGEVRAVAFAVGHGGVVSQGIQSVLGERLAAGVGFVAAGVVVVLVVFGASMRLTPCGASLRLSKIAPGNFVIPVVNTAGTVFMHQGVGGVLEGVVLHGHGGGFDPFFVGELEHAGLLCAATGFGVAGNRVQFRSFAVVVGEDQGRLFSAIHGAMLVAVVPAFFGGQAFQELQVAFPVLNAVFPFFWGAFEVEDGVNNASLFEQGAHNGIGGLGLEDAAVVHQAQTPHRGLNHHFVAGAAVAGVATDKLVHHTGEAAQGLAILPNHQVYRLFQNVRSGHIGVCAGQF